MTITRWKNFGRRNFDELAVAAALGRVAYDDSALGADDALTLQALRRTTPALEAAGPDEVRAYLDGLDEDQLQGVVSQVKGVLHELRVAEFENADGDTVTAALFPDPSHPGTDILFRDHATGESWEVQVKATDDLAYVRSWVESHPEGKIAVTEELAERAGLESTGLSNEELTADVEEFIDRALVDPSLWGFFPVLSLASASVAIHALWRRHRQGELNRDTFLRLAAAATGLKVGKLTALIALLSIPGVQVVTATVLIARLLLSAHRIVDARS